MRLYTLDKCPKCEILKTKISRKNLKIEIVNDPEQLKKLGIETVPVLEVDGAFLTFEKANNYINSK